MIVSRILPFLTISLLFCACCLQKRPTSNNPPSIHHSVESLAIMGITPSTPDTYLGTKLGTPISTYSKDNKKEITFPTAHASVENGIIRSFDCRDPEMHTGLGVSVGSSLEEIISKYGQAQVVRDKQLGDIVTYSSRNNDTLLFFYLKGGIVWQLEVVFK